MKFQFFVPLWPLVVIGLAAGGCQRAETSTPALSVSAPQSQHVETSATDGDGDGRPLAIELCSLNGETKPYDVQSVALPNQVKERAEQIREGMSEGQLIKRLGKPDDVHFETIKMAWEQGKDRLAAEVLDGKIIYVCGSTWHPDGSFELPNQNALTAKVLVGMTSEAVKKALGDPIENENTNRRLTWKFARSNGGTDKIVVVIKKDAVAGLTIIWVSDGQVNDKSWGVSW